MSIGEQQAGTGCGWLEQQILRVLVIRGDRGCQFGSTWSEAQKSVNALLAGMEAAGLVERVVDPPKDQVPTWRSRLAAPAEAVVDRDDVLDDLDLADRADYPCPRYRITGAGRTLILEDRRW